MSVTAAAGFVAAGVHCGIKAGGVPDLALVATDDASPVSAAAVFTSNLATAAPVLVSRAHLGATWGRAAAVVLNSGNANAATGKPGHDDAERMCALVAGELGCAVEDPFMPLSFMCLPVIPKLKVTDLGLVDVEKFAVVPLEV